MTLGPKLVDPATGCSLFQFCPCEGPVGDEAGWPSHKEYVKCIKAGAKYLAEANVILKEEYKLLVAEAEASQCGL